MRTTMLVLGGATALLLTIPTATAGRSTPATGADHLAMGPIELAYPMDGAWAQGQDNTQGKAQSQGNAQGKAQGRAQGQAQSQGQGQSQGRAQGQAQGQGRGQAQGPPGARAQGRGQGQGPPEARGRGNPPPDRAAFNRGLAERSVEVRARRNTGARGMTVRREGGNVRFLKADGTALFELPEEAADRMGYWWVNRVLGTEEAARRAGPDRDRDQDRDGGGIFGDILGGQEDADRGGAPAFCRSGAGHPVWGRGWCVDKGFGLGDRDGRWGWARTDDVTLRNPDPDRDVFDQGGLIDILGDVVFGRLAVQSLVLGADEPLAGRWIGQTDGPRVLRITAGDLPVAELVDAERDGSVDAIVFNLGG
ncbi:MAG: hypothetical protein WEB88_13425 [Gemmatimonadota bacterium]